MITVDSTSKGGLHREKDSALDRRAVFVDQLHPSHRRDGGWQSPLRGRHLREHRPVGRRPLIQSIAWLSACRPPENAVYSRAVASCPF